MKSETSSHPTNYEFIESIPHITQTDGSQDYREVLSITSSQFSDLSSDPNLEDSDNSFWEHWNRSTQELSIHNSYEDSESDFQDLENVEVFDTSPKINFRTSCVAAPQHLIGRNNSDGQIEPSRESPELKEEWGQHIVKHMIESLAAHEGVPVTEIQTWVDSLQESESETEGIPDRASMKRFSFYALKMHFKSLLNNNTKNCNQTRAGQAGGGYRLPPPLEPKNWPLPPPPLESSRRAKRGGLYFGFFRVFSGFLGYF